MSEFIEIGRVGSTAYGVRFVICGNQETFLDNLGFGLEANYAAQKAADAAMEEGKSAITKAGFFYRIVREFRAYHGGPHVGIFEPEYAVADVDESGDVGEWRRTWQKGAGATPIPANISEVADAVIDAAYAAANKSAKAAIKAEEEASAMHTVMVTNSAFDSILLVNDRDEVVSAWEADERVIADYLRHGDRADKWERGQWPAGTYANGGEPCIRIEDYGEECGRDGEIESASRRAYWRA